MGNKLTYRVEPYVDKNRLEINVKGQICKKDFNSLYTDIRFAVADLSDDFDVMTDLSECEFGSLDAIETLSKITSFFIENKVKSVVRIVNDKQLISRQILNFELRTTGLQVIYVNSKEEAETELEKTGQRDGLRFNLVKHSIDYITGTGTILDISTTGCAIEAKVTVPEPFEEVYLTITFKHQEGLIDNFKCAAKTMWVDDKIFAVKFESLDNILADDLYKRLAHECK